MTPSVATLVSLAVTSFVCLGAWGLVNLAADLMSLWARAHR